jgi:hypothetical protein
VVRWLGGSVVRWFGASALAKRAPFGTAVCIQGRGEHIKAPKNYLTGLRVNQFAPNRFLEPIFRFVHRTTCIHEEIDHILRSSASITLSDIGADRISCLHQLPTNDSFLEEFPRSDLSPDGLPNRHSFLIDTDVFQTFIGDDLSLLIDNPVPNPPTPQPPNSPTTQPPIMSPESSQ